MEKALNANMGSLQDKLVDNQVTASEYNDIKTRYQKQLMEIQGKKAEGKLYLAGLEKDISNALNLMENIDSFYVTAPVEVKQKMIGSIFPGKLLVVKENVRTNEVNSALQLICINSKALRSTKKGQPLVFEQLSSVVPGAGIESTWLAPVRQAGNSKKNA